MFRDGAQRSRVFAHLREGGMLPEPVFGAQWPREPVAPATELDPQQERLARVALAIWSGSGALPLADVVSLDEPMRRTFGSLLMAIGLGHAAVDRWLEESLASDD
jgi:hypothetical protein